MNQKLAENSVKHQSQSQPKTIAQWLEDGANIYREAIAISDTERQLSLSYQALFEQTQTIATQLYSLGLKPEDVVVIALNNGADFLTSILSVASVATAFPLNPHQPEAEYNRYFSQLEVKAVIVAHDLSSAICSVASSLNIPIFKLNCDSQAPAGQFLLSAECPSTESANTQMIPTKIVPKLSDRAILVGTSGATGSPKIISLTHESFFVSISHAADWMQLTKGDRSLVLTPLAMLHALVRSSCPLLLQGGKVVCTPGYNPAKILDWLDQYQPSFFTAVPSIYRSILQRIQETNWTPQTQSLRFLVTGSDKIEASEIEAVEKTLKVPLVQFYGMSEVSPLPVVRPFPPTVTPPGAVGQVNPVWQVACLDESGRILPPEEEGEIVLRGGYINQLVGISQDHNPKDDHENWFHTGDLGYLDADNFLYFTGRVDNRINRGGKKVYARDVEAVFLTHPAIKAAVVFGIPDTLYGECIGAVVVLHDKEQTTPDLIRQFMLKRIAEFKVPDLILIKDAIPLNPFGKVKRKTLATHFGLQNIFSQKKQTALSNRVNYTAPHTPTERNLAKIWSNLLEIDFLSVNDNFFALGGHSLLAIQMLSQIQAVFAVNLPMHKLFASPILKNLALEIEQLPKTDALPLPPLKPISQNKIPILYGQKKYWFCEGLENTKAFYSIVRTLEIEGDLDVKVLQQSLQTMVDRHAIFRTIFVSQDDAVYQKIHDNVKIKLNLIDLQKIPPSKRKFIAYELLKQEAQRAFDLTKEYLIRFSLSRLSTTNYIFTVNMHHMISDGLSIKIFWQELASIYNALIEGNPNPLPPLSIQYADFVYWQQQSLEGAKAQANYQYWSQQLADFSLEIDLPYDRPKPAVPTYGRGKRVYFELNSDKTQQLRHFCQTHNCTFYTIFLATWQLLLYYYCGQTVFVASSISFRDRAEIESLIGMFCSLLLLRTDHYQDQTFENFLAQVYQNCLEAYTHQHIALEELLYELHPERDLRSSMASVGFWLDNFSQLDLQMSGLQTNMGRGVSDWKMLMDLQLVGVELEPELWSVNLFYNSELFNDFTASQIITEFQLLFNTVISYPQQTLNQLLHTSSLNHSPFVVHNYQ